MEGIASTTNFYLQYQGGNDIELQKMYGEFAAKVMAANFPRWGSEKKLTPSFKTGERIRIGYISSCMYAHTVGIFLLGWLQGSNRGKFEIFCYHVGDRTDDVTSAIRDGADHFDHLHGNTADMAAKIESDALHILVHTDVGMNPLTLQLAALRLAPVQCKGWGHPVTTGLPTIDFYLSSDLMEIPEADRFYSEKLIRLPNLALNYTLPAMPTTPKSRAQLGIPDETFIYLSTQSIFKYLPQHDDVYPLIAAQVPNACFVFLAHSHHKATAQFEARLTAAFERCGQKADFIFLPRLSHADFLSLNLAADVLLDTLEWSGGKTTLEALACDLPAVTCPGELMRSRHTYAFLTRMGLTQTIARDKAEYVRIAVALGRDRALHAELRDAIRAKKHLLFNDPSVVQALETFYVNAYADSCARNKGTTPVVSELAAVRKRKQQPEEQSVVELIAEGETLVKRGCWEKALICFERSLASIPGHLGMQPWFQKYLLDGRQPPPYSEAAIADIYANLSLCQMAQGNIEDSRQSAETALRFAPRHQTALEMRQQAIARATPPADHPLSGQSSLPAPHPPSPDMLSILMLTHFSRKLVRYKELAPPTVGLVDATYSSATRILLPGFSDCPKWLCFDRGAESDPNEHAYAQQLQHFSAEHGFHYCTFDQQGLQSIVRQMIDRIQTPYLLFLEHDWAFQPPAADMAALLDLFEQQPQINSIRFNKRCNILTRTDFLMKKETHRPGIELLQTVSHSNNPFIVRVSTLKEQWLPICLNDPICRKRKIRGTAFGLEDPLFKRHVADVRRWGFSKAHQRWGTYVFGPYDAPPKVIHLGE